MIIEKQYAFNTAQLRNLRNWAVEELPSKVLTVVTTLAEPKSSGQTKTAVEALVRRHEALRSRLVYGPDGTPALQVIRSDDAIADLACDDREFPSSLPLPELVDELAAERVDPAERALRCTFCLQTGQVVAVLLSVSHVFADGISGSVLSRDLGMLIRGACARLEPPPQPDEYCSDSFAAKVAENTGYWKRLLQSIPRSCTYSGVERDLHEAVQVAQIPLPPGWSADITSAAHRLRVTPYIVWVAAVSSMVQAITGQSRQVFRSTYANRTSAREFNAVAQLAQAVFVPISGSVSDTLGHRVTDVFQTTSQTYNRGSYNANELLDYLNHPSVYSGVMFQPAFEVNFLSVSVGDLSVIMPGSPASQGLDPEIAEVHTRIDPPSGKADLVVMIFSQENIAGGQVIQLSARRPVHKERDVARLLKDLLCALHMTCTEPERQIAELPVSPFGSGSRLRAGHHSGAAVDLGMTERLMLGLAGVQAVKLRMRHNRLVAYLRSDDPAAARGWEPEITEQLRLAQPWFSGSVVPDEIVIV